MPEPSDINLNSSNRPIQPHHFQTESTTPTPLGRLKVALSAIFGEKKAESIPVLAGRIVELHSDAAEIQTRLQEIKDTLFQVVDSQYFNDIKLAFYQLEKEIERLKAQKTPTSDQMMTKYVNWIREAKVWADLFSENSHNHEAMIKVVIELAIKGIHEQIDGDLKSFEDYAKHENKSAVLNEISEEFLPILSPLIDLKNKVPVSLQELNAWKAEVDSVRAQCCERAYNFIDSLS